MPKIGGRRKKLKSHKQIEREDEEIVGRTFVFKNGKSSLTCKHLVKDLRKCFYPHTAMKLEDSNKLAMKSYLKAAKFYSVTHLLALQQSNQNLNLRIIKTGGGEMRFRVLNYCRMKQVVINGGQPFSASLKQPLLVLNNFSQTGQMQRIGRAIQELFPPLNLDQPKSLMRRVVSFTYQPNKKCIYFRHYKIIMSEGGHNAAFKTLLNPPYDLDLSNFRAFSDYLSSQNTHSHGKQHQQTVKLQQMGPRMKLKFLTYHQNSGVLENDEEEEQQQEFEEQKVNNRTQIQQQGEQPNQQQEEQIEKQQKRPKRQQRKFKLQQQHNQSENAISQQPPKRKFKTKK